LPSAGDQTGERDQPVNHLRDYFHRVDPVDEHPHGEAASRDPLHIGEAARQHRSEGCLDSVVAFGAQLGCVVGAVDPYGALGCAHAVGRTGVDPLVLVLVPELLSTEVVALGEQFGVLA